MAIVKARKPAKHAAKKARKPAARKSAARKARETIQPQPQTPGFAVPPYM